jgi:predicted nuclease of predicted toxin-antitoxin system
VKIKLDEHLGSLRVVTWLRFAGHDVATVREQGLTSTPDEEVIEVCRSEERCLVSCDRGFGNRLKYNPANYAGIIVIRLPSHHNFDDLRAAIDTLIMGLEEAEVTGKLWIIQRGSIQEYQAIEPDM